MPIRYHCRQCGQFISIATRMAGQSVNCPTCGAARIVPPRDEIASSLEPPTPPAEPPSPRRAADIATLSDDQPQEGPKGPPPSAAPPMDSQLGTRQLTQDEWQAAAEQAQQRQHSAPDPVSEPLSPAEPDPETLLDEQFRWRNRRLGMPGLDLLPLAQFAFLLSIAVMAIGAGHWQRAVELVPAPSAQVSGAPRMTLMELRGQTTLVRIDARNRIFLQETLVENQSRLGDLLQTARRDSGFPDVALDVHPDALHDTVVTVMEAAMAAKMTRIRLVSRPDR